MLYVLGIFVIAVVALLILAAKEGKRQMDNHCTQDDLSWYGPENTDDN